MVLTASGSTSAEYRWYDPNGNLVPGETTSTINIDTISQTTTYEVSAFVGGCESSRVQVTGTVSALPAQPTGIGNTRCGSGIISLSASGSPTGEYRWYAPNGSQVAGATTGGVSVNVTSTVTYQVVSYDNGCESNRVNVTATVNATPNQPSVVGDTNCGTGTVTLTASGSSSNQYRW